MAETLGSTLRVALRVKLPPLHTEVSLPAKIPVFWQLAAMEKRLNTENKILIFFMDEIDCIELIEFFNFNV